MINKSVDLIELDVRRWLQHNWPDYEQWGQGKDIPETAVLQAFLAEFAKPAMRDQLHHYLRALGRAPFLQLNRSIAKACCIDQPTMMGNTHVHSNQSVLMITAIELGFAEYLFAQLLAEVRQRHTFGTPLIRNQHVEFTLAELQARLFAFSALWELMSGNQDFSGNLELLQSLVRPLTHELADQYLQFSGGRGYLKGHAAGWAFRQVFMD